MTQTSEPADYQPKLCTSADLRRAANYLDGLRLRGIRSALQFKGMCVALHETRGGCFGHAEADLAFTHKSLGFSWTIRAGDFFLRDLPPPCTEAGCIARVQRLRLLADMLEAKHEHDT